MDSREYSVGKLIRSIRKNLHISQGMICRGLCSLNAYVRIEQGDIEPNPYMVSLVFERLGISINKYGFVYSLKEYKELEKRYEIMEELKERNWERLEPLLAEYQDMIKSTSYHKQFLEYVRLMGLDIRRMQEGDLLKRAVKILRLTLPDFDERKITKYRYTKIERTLILFIADTLCGSGRQDEGIFLLKELLKNMEAFIVDEEELVEAYPAAALLITEHLWSLQRYEENSFCEKAIALLRRMQKLHGLLPLLKLQLESQKALGQTMSEEGTSVFRREQEIAALEKVAQDGHFTDTFREDIFLRAVEETVQGIPMEKLFRSLRIGKGITGAQLSEAICEPENYSRIERGVVSPYSNNYFGIMQKLGREAYKYYPNVVSSDYQAHLLYREISRDIARFRYQEANDKLQRLREMLDMGEVLNQQSCEFTKAVTEARIGRIDSRQKEEILWKCFRLTVPENVNVATCPLTHMEVKILSGIALAEMEQENLERAIEIQKEVKRACERNSLFLQSASNNYFMIVHNLIKYLILKEEYEEALEMSKNYARLAYDKGEGYGFLALSYLDIWNQEKVLEKQAYTLPEIKKICEPRWKNLSYAAGAAGQHKLKELIAEHSKTYYNNQK